MYLTLNPAHINLSDLPFKTCVELFSKYGFKAIDTDPVKVIKEYTLDGVQDILGSNGMFFSAFWSPVMFQEGNKEEYERTFELLEPAAKAARSLGIHRCVTWILNFSDAYSYNENFEMHRKVISEIANVLGDYDIRFGLEFVGPSSLAKGHKYPFIRTLKEIQELKDTINKPNLGVLFDCYHWYTAGLDNSAFDDFSSEKEIVMVHINDALKGMPLDECLDGTRYLPGEGGGIDVGDFLKRLQAMNYSGPVELEPFSERINAMSDPDEIMTAVRDSIDSVWPTDV